MSNADVEGLKNVKIKEKWTINVNATGEARISVIVEFKNVSADEQNLTLPYKFKFKREEKPTYLRFDGKEVPPEDDSHTLPLKLHIKPNKSAIVDIDMGYSALAKPENNWWNISLYPKHGAVSPHELTIECFLPMGAENIVVRGGGFHDVNDYKKKIVFYFPSGGPYFINFAYKLKGGKKNVEAKGPQVVPSFCGEDIKDIRDRMPLLCGISSLLSKELKDRKPFLGKNFLIILHFLKDLIVFLEACEKLGLKPSKTYLFYKPYLYPHKDSIISFLKSKGYVNIFPIGELSNLLGKLDQQLPVENVMVLEDGGYITPLLHRNFSNLLRKTIGAVEQTTKGIRKDKNIQEIKIPIFNVAEAEIKRRIEPPHIADAIIQNIRALLDFEKLRGRKVALMGYGTIGVKVAEKLRNEGLHVTIYDPESNKRMQAREDGYAVEEEPYNAVKNKFLVIGCSGETSIGRKEILSLKHKTYVISTSSDQIEVDLDALDALSRKKLLLTNTKGKKIGTTYIIRGKGLEIRLLCDGYPVNFWCSESMPDQVSDLILSLIFLSAYKLATNKYPVDIHNVDSIVEEFNVDKMYEEYYAD